MALWDLTDVTVMPRTLLELALQRFALDVALEAGYTLMTTPDLARAEVLQGIGFNPRGEETQVYSIADSDLCLVGTSEITLGGLYMDTIIDEKELPHTGVDADVLLRIAFLLLAAGALLVAGGRRRKRSD